MLRSVIYRCLPIRSRLTHLLNEMACLRYVEPSRFPAHSYVVGLCHDTISVATGSNPLILLVQCVSEETAPIFGHCLKLIILFVNYRFESNTGLQFDLQRRD